MIILSILIPTIPDRAEMFSRLFNCLYKQIAYMHTFHGTLGRIEILIDDSPKFLHGGLSIGKKRESLVKRAEGKYLCFLDDDDWIAPNYVETLVRLCVHDADVCTFRNLTRTDYYWTVVDMSLDNPNNEPATPESIVKRKPFHICPVKSEYAKLYNFDDINNEEDWKWMEKVLTHCSIQAKTDMIVHEYNHGKHSEANKIMNHA